MKVYPEKHIDLISPLLSFLPSSVWFCASFPVLMLPPGPSNPPPLPVPGESSVVFWIWVRCTCSVLPPSSCCSASPIHAPPARHRCSPHLCASVPHVDVSIRDSVHCASLCRWQVCPLKAGPCLTSLPALKGLLEGAVTPTTAHGDTRPDSVPLILNTLQPAMYLAAPQSRSQYYPILQPRKLRLEKFKCLGCT